MSNFRWALACAAFAAVINFLIHGSFWAAVLGAGPVTFIMAICLFYVIDVVNNHLEKKQTVDKDVPPAA